METMRNLKRASRAIVAVFVTVMMSGTAQSQTLISSNQPSNAVMGNMCSQMGQAGYCHLKDRVCETAEDLFGYGTSYINGAAELLAEAAGSYEGATPVSALFGGSGTGAALGATGEAAGAAAGSSASSLAGTMGTIAGTALTVATAAAGLAQIAAGSAYEKAAQEFLDSAAAAAKGERQCRDACAWLSNPRNCP